MDAGIYDDMTNLVYHSQTDWVGSTQLKRLLPEHYGPEPKNRTALDLGSALHTRILGGPSEPIRYHDFPTWQSKAAIEAQRAAYSAGEIPVLEKDRLLIEAMHDAVKNHSEASELLFGTGGQSEVSVFAEVDSVPSKARFDRIIGTTAVDLKTTSEMPGASNLSKAVVRWGYDTSAAHYMEVARAAGIELDSFVLVFVEKTEPYRVTVCELDEAFLERGLELRDQALQRHCHSEMVDPYPGATGRLSLSPPGWARL